MNIASLYLIFIGSKWDVVILDINSSDANCELWGPTKEFIDEKFLVDCKSILDEKTIGSLVINLICLSQQLRASILERLKTLYIHVFVNQLPKNRNEIIFCTNISPEALFYKQPFEIAKCKNHNHLINSGDVMHMFQSITNNMKEI